MVNNKMCHRGDKSDDVAISHFFIRARISILVRSYIDNSKMEHFSYKDSSMGILVIKG